MKVKVDDTLLGDPQNIVHALAGGGSIGCDTVSYVSNVPLRVGDTYVFFFWLINDSDGIVRGNLMLSVAYPVAADGTVSRPDEPALSLVSLAAMIRAGVVPTPSPTAPGDPIPTDSGPG